MLTDPHAPRRTEVQTTLKVCDVAGPGQGLSGDFYLVTQKLRKSYEIRKFSSCAKIAPNLPKIKVNYTKITAEV